MKKILVVTTFNNHFHFFYRLSQTLIQFGFETHFLTNKYSIFLEAQKLDQKIYFLSKERKSVPDVDILNSFEVSAGSITTTQANLITSSVWSKLEVLNRINNYEYNFLWGGVRLIELTSAEFAFRNYIKALFFELGNFPNKIFVDPKGTNARSLLAEKPEVLDTMNIDPEMFNQWRTEYIAKSLSNHLVPQSGAAAGVEYKKNLLDIYGFRFRKLIQNESLITKEKLLGKYLRKVIKLEYDQIDLDKTDYLFFPMQVNKDAQLILNSKIGNLEALKLANKIAEEKGLKLVVKPHPGEVEFGFIKKVNNLKNSLGFCFVNNNTIELVHKSKEVATINSTVGLQAKILNKPVTCFGKAFYDKFDENRLAAYLQSYLIDADFWNDNKIDTPSAEQILNRAELK